MLVNLKKLRTRHKNRLDRGIYETRGWYRYNFDFYLEDHGVAFLQWIDTYKNNNNINTHGVCDNYEQILERFPDIIYSNNKYVIGLTKVKREEQPRFGGWRWHKWGEYIGTQQPTTEYLYDEEYVEQVYVYTVFQIIE